MDHSSTNRHNKKEHLACSSEFVAGSKGKELNRVGHRTTPRSPVLCIAESQHRPTNERKKKDKQCHPDALSEGNRQLIHYNNGKYDIRNWYQKQNDPPKRLANDFKQNNTIVNGDNGRPPGLPAFSNVFHMPTITTTRIARYKNMTMPIPEETRESILS
jgi:hypothetical protein